MLTILRFSLLPLSLYTLRRAVHLSSRSAAATLPSSSLPPFVHIPICFCPFRLPPLCLLALSPLLLTFPRLLWHPGRAPPRGPTPPLGLPVGTAETVAGGSAGGDGDGDAGVGVGCLMGLAAGAWTDPTEAGHTVAGVTAGVAGVADVAGAAGVAAPAAAVAATTAGMAT